MKSINDNIIRHFYQAKIIESAFGYLIFSFKKLLFLLISWKLNCLGLYEIKEKISLIKISKVIYSLKISKAVILDFFYYNYIRVTQ